MTCRWFICALIVCVCLAFFAGASWLDYYGEGSFKWEDLKPVFASVAGFFAAVGLLAND